MRNARPRGNRPRPVQHHRTYCRDIEIRCSRGSISKVAPAASSSPASAPPSPRVCAAAAAAAFAVVCFFLTLFAGTLPRNSFGTTRTRATLATQPQDACARPTPSDVCRLGSSLGSPALVLRLDTFRRPVSVKPAAELIRPSCLDAWAAMAPALRQRFRAGDMGVDDPAAPPCFGAGLPPPPPPPPFGFEAPEPMLGVAAARAPSVSSTARSRVDQPRPASSAAGGCGGCLSFYPTRMAARVGWFCLRCCVCMRERGVAAWRVCFRRQQFLDNVAPFVLQGVPTLQVGSSHATATPALRVRVPAI